MCCVDLQYAVSLAEMALVERISNSWVVRLYDAAMIVCDFAEW